MEFVELSHDELDQVNGAFLQGAAIGAGAYLLGSAFNGGFSWGGLAEQPLPELLQAVFQH